MMAEDTGNKPDGTANPGDVTPPEGGKDTPKAAERTFTQADMERIVGERLARERAKYEDYADLKKAADELAKLKEAELTESEKATKRIAALEEQLAATAAESRARLIESAVTAEAAKAGFYDAADAVRLVDTSLLRVEEGKVTGVAEAVKQLAEQRAYLIKGKTGQLEPFAPGGSGSPVKETDEQRRARIFKRGGAWASQDGGGGVIWPKGKPNEKLPGG